MVQRQLTICVTDRKENSHKTSVTLKNRAQPELPISGNTDWSHSTTEKSEGAIGAFTDR
jgi:hypothetical protein